MSNSDDLRSRAREILLFDWDPSNASRFEASRGEYDSYLAPLLALIQAGDEAGIIEYLYDREREIMCFPGLGKERLRRVAKKLLGLKTAGAANSETPK